MAAPALRLKALACPFCDHEIDETRDFTGEDVKGPVRRINYACSGCRKPFTFYRPAAAPVAAAVAKPKSAEQSASASTWLFFAALAFGLNWLTRGVSGPTFLMLYAALFFVLYLPTLGGGLESRMLGLVPFELVGVLRIFHGVHAGHHKFTYLLLMMIVGAVIFASDGESGGGGGGGSWFSRGSCSCYSYHHHCHGGWWSGCGGGCGGGGGGCGGCGG